MWPCPGPGWWWCGLAVRAGSVGGVPGGCRVPLSRASKRVAPASKRVTRAREQKGHLLPWWRAVAHTHESNVCSSNTHTPPRTPVLGYRRSGNARSTNTRSGVQVFGCRTDVRLTVSHQGKRAPTTPRGRQPSTHRPPAAPSHPHAMPQHTPRTAPHQYVYAAGTRRQSHTASMSTDPTCWPVSVRLPGAAAALHAISPGPPRYPSLPPPRPTRLSTTVRAEAATPLRVAAQCAASLSAGHRPAL